MVGRRESPKAAIYDTTSYLAAVSESLHDEPAKYDEVIKIFIDFQFNRIDIHKCIIRLGLLFEDHPNLLRGLKYFLPESDETEEKISAVLILIREVKKQFDDEPAKFEEFVKILEDYRDERIDVAGAHARVMEFIKDHQNLVQATIPLNAAQQTDPLDNKD